LVTFAISQDLWVL